VSRSWGLWREALAHWERAVKLDPTYAPAYNNMAIGYEQQGEFEKARNAYEKALELNPNNAYINRTTSCSKKSMTATNKQDGPLASPPSSSRPARTTTSLPIETPIKAKLDVAAFQRVLVAGFLAGGTDDVDGNLETTRLLRSQLRTKSELRVIDADVLPLMDVAAGDRKADAGARCPTRSRTTRTSTSTSTSSPIPVLEEGRRRVSTAADCDGHGAVHVARSRRRCSSASRRCSTRSAGAVRLRSGGSSNAKGSA
jgi:hypothetical protein